MTKDEILNKKEYLTREDMKELDKTVNFEPLYKPRMFRGVFTKLPNVFKEFLNDMLDLKLDVEKTEIKIYNCELSDNILVLLNNDIFVEITFSKLDLTVSEEELPPENSKEDDKKLEFLKRNNFDMKNAKINYIFITEEGITTLKASLHSNNAEE